MKILAFEFSSPQRSVALLDAGDNGQLQVCGQVTEMIPTAPIKPLACVEKLLKSTGAEREEVGVVIVGLGPGSYTGVRTAISLAQGWQLGRGVKLLGVSSAACVAAWAQTRGLRGRVKVVIDAQRGEFYLASYELDEAGIQEVTTLQIASPEQVRAGPEAKLIGPEVTKWFPGGLNFFPQAATLGRLTAGRSDFVPGEKIEPIYLRETTFVKAPPPRVLPVL